jgi:glycosyltransferase involved in cell wall biosynthesis
MNILIINHYAGSPDLGMEFRPYFMAREWIKLNHKVTIVSGNYSHLRIAQPKVCNYLTCEKIDDINYIWLKTLSYRKSGFMRVLSILSFVFGLILKKNRIISLSKPQIVIASSTYPLDIYPAYLIAKKTTAKLVFELHDLWPLSPIIIGKYSNIHPYIYVMQKAENFACKKCDCYVSLLKNAKDYLIKHGLDGKKFIYIPNGFSEFEQDKSEIPLPEEHFRLLNKITSVSKLTIGYVGSLNPSDAIQSFLTSIKNIDNSCAISFVLVGIGSELQKLKKLVNLQDQKNVYFLPPVPKSAVPKLLSNFDILYAGGVKSELHSFGTSYNKIVDYMLAEKPIVFAVDDPDNIVKEAGCGLTVPAEDQVEIAKAIEYFLHIPNEIRNSIGKRGRAYALKELNYSILAKKFLAAVFNT